MLSLKLILSFISSFLSFHVGQVSLGMIGVLAEVTFQCEEAYNLREKLTIYPVDHCLQSLSLFSRQSDHGKLWIEAHSGVCALFSVWKTTEPISEEQGIWLWDFKVKNKDTTFK